MNPSVPQINIQGVYVSETEIVEWSLCVCVRACARGHLCMYPLDHTFLCLNMKLALSSMLDQCRAVL